MSRLRQSLRSAFSRLAHRLAPPELLTALRFLRTQSGIAFPKRNVEVLQKPPGGKVLILAPHPDDEAIGMGGSLAMLVAAGADITVIYVTDGGGPDPAERARLTEIRRAETQLLVERTGIKAVFFDAPDTGLTNDALYVGKMREFLRAERPDVIYTPSLFDHHYDHFMTNQILREALALESGIAPTVMGYEVWDNIPFPNVLVDVSAHQAEKEKLLACYATPHEYTDFTQLCRDRTAVYFTLYVNSEKRFVGKGFAEAFLRFDTRTFIELHDGYVASLRESKSELPSRIRASRVEGES